MTDWVTQKEAAEQRGVEVGVIGNWIRRRRLRHVKMEYGKRLVSLSEVLNHEPLKAGRPSAKKGGEK